MYAAVVARDASFDGAFVFGVRTTGVFCRPGCGARTPLRENVEFFSSTQEAERAGLRACKRGRPLESADARPAWVDELFARIERSPARVTARELRDAGVHPARAARWFQEHYGMTFQAYQRSQRIGAALSDLRDGADVSHAVEASGFESESGFRDAFRKLFGAPPTRLPADARIVRLRRLETPLGEMLAAACDEGLCMLEFVDRNALPRQIQQLRKHVGPAIAPGDHALLDSIADELTRYFERSLRRFTTPLFAPGTPFQERVWSELQRIPHGETRSYAQLAAAIGQPTAVRAVASANARNRLAILIPCHRVIASNGDLAGYAGQVWRKQRLLELERPDGSRVGARA